MSAMPQTTPDDRGGDEHRRGADGHRPGRPDPATEAFVAHRNLLFTVAYEMLGSAADAEDVLQEAWLRWIGVDLATIADPRAYLVRITTRQSLDRLRTLGRRKESYVGPWLPEPLRTAPDVADDIELAENLSMAMLLVLETLAPLERAVFVLREVFTLDYDEIAEAVSKTPTAVRQLAYRARSHVAARRPRGVVSPADTRDAVAAFQRAIETGDLQHLVDILAPDVVFLGDGGGIAQAALTPIIGAEAVAALLSVGLSNLASRSLEPAQVNGHPALILRLDDEIDTMLAVRVDNGLITALYSLRNPCKLSRLHTETPLHR
ncbi:RNA polymerase sigma-70 factor [Nocardia concava]|uniref:RNA polymerase sigma-70 factor n=1 Tax=Nocardia concava TaxID=257281 RepID=UPI00059389B1|nr:RNA polymerase sigma-70 factor [Nocardia concava]